MPRSRDPYLDHFRLQSEPFGLSPGVEHLYLGKEHSEALAGLQIGIRQRRGLITLVGEVGMGKTTLAHAVIRAMDERVHIGYTATTTLSFVDMMRPAMLELGLGDCLDGKARMLWGLSELLKIADQRGQIVALIVDEAHNLRPDAFEELRLLLNIETVHEKLLQLVLVGQPELEDRLNEHGLRHLADRVAVRCVLNPLSRKESGEYFRARMESAGASQDLFTPKALRSIVREARGIPRGINILCHNALLFAFGEGCPRVEARHARTAIEERRGGRLKRLDRREPKRRSRRPLFVTAAIAAAMVVGVLGGIAISRERSLFWERSTAAERPPAQLSERPATSDGAPPRAGGGIADEGGGIADEDGIPDEGGIAEGAVADGSADEDSPIAIADGPEGAEPPSPPPAEEATSRVIVVETGSSLSSLMFDVYGDYRPELLAMVLAANPDISDPDFLLPGQRVVLPEPPER